MKTEKLYFRNPYQVEFSANCIHIVDINGKTGVILDRTAFYPTGGGQPHDTGYINDYPVIDVIEDGESIIHVIDGKYQGETHVMGKIDWNRRFDHMQQHSAQHILSAVLKSEYGIETVGFHLGSEVVTIDIATTNDPPFVEVENKVNEIILRRLPIDSQFIARSELDADLIRKVPNQDPFIRIVEIPNIDVNACCGTHPSYTSEVGFVKLLGSELVRGNRRISFVAGWRAVRKFQTMFATMTNIAKTLKTNTEDVENRIYSLRDELEQLTREYRRVSQEMIYWEALDWHRRYEPLGEYRFYFHVWQNRSFQEVKELAKTIIETERAIVIFATKDHRAQVVLACSQDVPVSMQEVANELAELIQGRGGGSRVFSQVGGDSTRLEIALEDIRQKLEQRMN